MKVTRIILMLLIVLLLPLTMGCIDSTIRSLGVAIGHAGKIVETAGEMGGAVLDGVSEDLVENVDARRAYHARY